MKQAMINYVKNGPNDEVYTPAKAVKAVLPYLPNNKLIEDFVPAPTVWCPCDTEDSQIVKVLREAGYTVIASHIDDGKDFFEYEPEHWDFICTNPPYSIKDKFLKRCYEFGKPFALLLPLTALEGIQRGRLYRKYGISVVVLDKRINFTGGKGAWFNTSWFLWNPAVEGNRLAFVEVEDE